MGAFDVDVASGADADGYRVVLSAQLTHDLDDDIDDVLGVVARRTTTGSGPHFALGVDDPRRPLRPADVHADRQRHVSRSIRSTPLRPLPRGWSWVSTTVRTAARNAVVASARGVNVSRRARRASAIIWQSGHSVHSSLPVASGSSPPAAPRAHSLSASTSFAASSPTDPDAAVTAGASRRRDPGGTARAERRRADRRRRRCNGATRWAAR